MPEYVKKVLERLQRPKLKRFQYAPHRWTVPAYGKIFHMAPDPDDSNIFEKIPHKRIKSIVGTILYYAQSADPSMLQAINEISRVQSKQNKGHQEKGKNVTRL